MVNIVPFSSLCSDPTNVKSTPLNFELLLRNNLGAPGLLFECMTAVGRLQIEMFEWMTAAL